MESVTVELIPIMDIGTARDYACRLHDAALDVLRHTMYEDTEQVKKLLSTLGLTVDIITSIDTVGVIGFDHLEWLWENSFSPYNDSFTVGGYPILDCIDVWEDDTVMYMVQCHDGTIMQYGRIEPGAYAHEYWQVV